MTKRIFGSGLLLLLASACGDSSSPPVPTRVTVSPGTSTLNAIGETRQFSAKLYDEKGKEIPGAVFTWATSAGQIASVNSSGLATAMMAGAAFVRATSEGVTGSATLNVDPLPDQLEKIAGDQQSGTLRLVLPDELTVEVRDSNGNPVVGKSVTFEVVAGGGFASPRQTETGLDGRASTVWHLGCSNANPQLLEARIGSLTVSFAANMDLAALAICQESVPRGRETLPYSSLLVAAGGDQGTLTWSIVSGAMPPGLTLQPSGELSGTPTLRGDYQFEAKVVDGQGAFASAPFELRVCQGPTLLNPGETRSYAPTGPDGCGFFLPAGNDGDRYRFGVVYTRSQADSTDVQSVKVEMWREAGGLVSPEFLAPLPAVRGTPARKLSLDFAGASMRGVETARIRENFHNRIRLAEQELIRKLGPNARPLPDRGGPALVSGPARNAPDKMSFTNSEDFSSCTVDETVRAVKIKEDDLLVIYQDSVQWSSTSTRLSDAHAQSMLDFYAAAGPQVIDGYFGGVTDINADGKIVVFVTPIVEEGTVAFVWSGDFFPKTQQIRDGVTWGGCAASNEMEMMRFSLDAIQNLTGGNYQVLGTLVHETKHISSLYKSIIRRDFQPGFVEEGTAEIAEEMASRIVWAGAGGPAVGSMVRGSDFNAFNEDNYAVALVNAGAVRYLSSQPNGVVVTPLGAAAGHSVYGSGWHFHRWLGDAYGNAATALADSAFFRTLNDSLTAVGAQGILDVTGVASWADLLEKYVAAIMVNGTGAPQGPRPFTTYDFPSTTEIFSSPDPPGVYPWPLNVSGEDTPAPFISDMDVGSTGPSGVRIFDVMSDGTGLGLEVVVTAGPASSPFRIVLVRLE